MTKQQLQLSEPFVILVMLVVFLMATLAILLIAEGMNTMFIFLGLICFFLHSILNRNWILKIARWYFLVMGILYVLTGLISTGCL